ncbi:MAG: respiratory nitrate reductase subunit gamma [Thaumarchaeota archaeon]|nr:respiratory nitrate reductase subunit gamma [Nitrososphaerota archaeon]
MIDFNSLLDASVIHAGGLVLLIWVVGGILFNLTHWRSTIRASVTQAGGLGGEGFAAQLKVLGVTFGRDVLLQMDMRGCSTRKWVSHLAVFWGFIILGLSTMLNFSVNPTAMPLPLSHVVRVLGNVGGVVFMVGLVLMIYERAVTLGSRRNTSFGDAFFIVLLFSVGFTGFMAELASEWNMASTTAVVYWVHLALVSSLFIVAPFSKFVHALGRALLRLFENSERS